MEPFRITCETCRSRLKIRSPEVIGEIHACPKCGSMVHIVPPAGWQANPAAMPTGEPGTPGEAALIISATASAIIPASVVADLPAVFATPELPSVETPAPVCPTAQAGSHLLLWAVGGTAVFLVGGLALAIWPSQDDNDGNALPSSVIAAKAAPVSEQPTPAPTTPPVDHQKSAVGDPYKVDHAKEIATVAKQAPAAQPAAIPAAVNSAPNTVAASTQPHFQLPAETKTENSKAIVSPHAAAVAESTPSNTTAQPPKAAEPAAKDNEHLPVLKFDPLDFDPDRLSVSAKTSARSETSTSSIPDQAPGEREGDRVADNGVASAGGVTRQDKQPAAGVVLPPPAADRSITVRRGQPAVEGSPPQKVGQQLATRVKAFQVTDMPMVRLIETLSDIAGSGITLDPVALELVGVSPRTTVTVNAQDATLEKILKDALTKQRLDFVEQGDQVRVSLPKPDERRAVDYDVKDLVRGTDAAAIGQLVEHFAAPTTWKAVGGAGTVQVNGTTLHIEQSDSVRRQVVIFCERLRLARGLALRSKYPAALLSVESPYEHLSAKFNEHTTFTFLAGTRLADVVRQWQEMSGLTIVVDWASLAEAELSPASPVACSAIDRTWQEALDGILEPLSLGWWAVDGQTIQITSLGALEKIQRIEFYQVPQKLRAAFASGQALIDSLQKEVGEAAGKQGKPGQARMELDEPSGRLIVLGNPQVHRYLSRRIDSLGK